VLVSHKVFVVNLAATWGYDYTKECSALLRAWLDFSSVSDACKRREVNTLPNSEVAIRVKQQR